MQNYKKTETPEKLVFESKIEVIPGGRCVAVKDIFGGRVYAGAPLRKDSNGLYHVIKTAKVAATVADDATEIKVAKGSHFKAGDKIGINGSCGNTISAIDHDGSTSYDTITVSATLGVALSAGDVLEEVTITTVSESTTYAGLKADGFLGETFDVQANDNHLQSVVVRGSIVEACLANPMSAYIKSNAPLMRFV